MRKPKFEMITDKDGKVRFYLRAATGEIVLTSRYYLNMVEAIQGIDRVMRFGAVQSRFIQKETLDGKFYFQLLSASGRVIGQSPIYHSKLGCHNGIVAVRRSVQFGKVLDLN
jgi:uncharacterized protein YegP (UPF0339 family)